MSKEIRNRKDVLMEKSNMDALFVEGDYAVVNITKTRKVTSDPWIVHYCYDKMSEENAWNYVLSSLWAVKNIDTNRLYICTQCDKRAPDSVITVLEMLR